MFEKRSFWQIVVRRKKRSRLISRYALIDPKAELDSRVEVGPYSIIGPNVQIAAGTWIGPHVVIKGSTQIGCDNKIYQFASLGEDPQSKKYQGEPESRLEIGDRNIIREYCSIHRGTAEGGEVTRLGNDNWLMAYCHIAHDCQVGNQTVFANAVALGGHVWIDDYVNLGGATVIHQFCMMGKYSFAGGNSGIGKDVPPFVTVFGTPAKPYGINKEGLKRQHFSNEMIRVLHQAYKIVYRQNLTIKQATEALKNMSTTYPEIHRMVTFIEQSTRGIVR
jgi:UDP-N-acetylglucosamine acyltransferase